MPGPTQLPTLNPQEQAAAIQQARELERQRLEEERNRRAQLGMPNAADLGLTGFTQQQPTKLGLDLGLGHGAVRFTPGGRSGMDVQLSTGPADIAAARALNEAMSRPPEKKPAKAASTDGGSDTSTDDQDGGGTDPGTGLPWENVADDHDGIRHVQEFGAYTNVWFNDGTYHTYDNGTYAYNGSGWDYNTPGSGEWSLVVERQYDPNNLPSDERVKNLTRTLSGLHSW